MKSFIPTIDQVAFALHDQAGFVWLDSLYPSPSSLPQESGRSLLGANPTFILKGILQKNKRELEEEIDSFTQHHPSGGVIGYVRYDGSFLFGFYPLVYEAESTHHSFSWIRPPELDFSQTIIKKSLSRKKEKKFEPLSFRNTITKKEFCFMVQQAQEEIKKGNVYQLCLAHALESFYSSQSSWHLYQELRKKTPAPFSAYLNLGEEIVLSTSPECFLEMNQERIATYPIKGTSRRGENLEEDTIFQKNLKNSQKEQAELVMITDLERNDLSQICEYGSVQTPELLSIKTYPQLFHLFSKVEGRLKEGYSHLEALSACFPGGSISGAPKKSAMELISKLEPTPRGIFTGSIGYFKSTQKSEFNIAIRTLVLKDKKATLHVGAGITLDSNPEEEWKETLLKGSGIINALGSLEIFD